MAYATLADLINRFDQRTIAGLVSDGHEEAGDLANNTKISTALSIGSGMINSAVMVADLYTAEQLADLAGDDLALLVHINCCLAMGVLLGRRPEKYGDDGVARLVEWADKMLDDLRKGVRIFNIQQTKDAGLPTIDGPTAVEYANLNLMPDRVQRFYPSRSSRLPFGRG